MILPARRLAIALAMLAFAVAVHERPAAAAARPNVLLIVADDLGYSDLACYGGEIETRQLDRLAADGLRFTQFYNTARCWPSRAAILTGYYAQAVRRDAIAGLGGGAQGIRPGFARLLPEFLKPLGYRTYHSGKWHVDGSPIAGGFDHSYVLADHDRNFYPREHFEDDRKLPPVDPSAGYYSTVAIADHAIKCLKEHSRLHAGKPFFEYLCFTVPHFPLHALPDDIARYRGRFAQGWDVLRAERLARMRAVGLVDCELSPRTPGVPAWNSLSGAEQMAWQQRMEVHAAMVDRMDREIGRVVETLRMMNAFDNTIIMLLSDNGASAERVLRGDGHDPAAPPGSARSYLCIEPPWANLANTPFRRSKIFVHEGGIATPLVVHWPAGALARGELRHNPSHVVDLVPTILDWCGGSQPAEWHGRPMPVAPGRSLVPAMAKDNSVEHDCLWWYHSGNRAIRIGDWKLVSEGERGPWELYDLSVDRGESNNLAGGNPFVVNELEKAWLERLETCRALAAEDAK
jgi:arylsulfatase A-like enzyme